MVLRSLALIAAFSASPAAALPAAPAASLYELSGAVRSNDLDLASQSGMSAFEQRVKEAGRQACSGRARIESRRCRHEFRFLAMSRAELAMGPRQDQVARNP